MNRQPTVLDVAVLCLTGLLGVVLILLSIGRLLDGAGAAVPLSVAAAAVVTLTVLIWRNGSSAPVARVLGLSGFLVAVVVADSGPVWLLVVGGVLAAELVSQHHRSTT